MNVLIVEDHALVRDLLRQVCVRDFRCTVETAETAEIAIERSARTQPDLVLLDLCLPDFDGFHVIERIRKAGQHPRVLAFSVRCDPWTVHRCEKLRFEGFLDKRSAAPDEIRAAVKAIAAGGRYFSASVRELLREQQSDPLAFHKILTDRQQQVLQLVADLKTDEEIGKELDLSAETAEKHRFRIMQRLGINSKVELLRYARRMGFTRL